MCSAASAERVILAQRDLEYPGAAHNRRRLVKASRIRVLDPIGGSDGQAVVVAVVSRPLAPYAAGFERWLWSRAYSPSTVASRLSQLDQLSRWLECQGLGARELTPARAAQFASSRREAGLVTWTSPRSAALPLGYLRGLEVVPLPAAAEREGLLEKLVDDYRRYLTVERGLSEKTVLNYYPGLQMGYAA
jgi:integrase/recombinase XerD